MNRGWRWAAASGMWVAVAVVACAPAAGGLKGALAAGDEGRVSFTPDGRTAISGDLEFPEGERPVAAVVLMHGCGGIGNAETGWAPVLRRAGYATLAVDSLGGRRLREICTDPSALSINTRIADAHAALAIVPTHPGVDRSRIARMGFSHGGGVALRAATAWARARFGRPGGPRYRAFLPFYPSCVLRFPEQMALAGPVRIHHGELDDWTPAAPCERLVRDLRARGQDADITLYPGAHHSFDNPGRPVRRLTSVMSIGSCQDVLLPSITAPVGRHVQGCLTRGATTGWSPEATEAARRRVVAQLGELLRPSP